MFNIKDFSNIYSRWMLHYVDWCSHFLSLEDLNVEDKLRLMVSRMIVISYQLPWLKCPDKREKRIPIGGGAYFPVCAQKLKVACIPEA